MGEVRASVLLENGGDRELALRGMVDDGRVRRVQADLLVDTGAVLVLLPQDMVESLGLTTIDRVVVTRANDERLEMPRAGPLTVTIQAPRPFGPDGRRRR